MAITQTKIRHKLTLEAFRELPEVEPALEYFEGVVRQKVPPLGEHSVLQLALADYLNRQVEPGKIARAFVELRTTFGGASVVPDVSVYRWERIPRTPTGRVASRFLTPPDMAIEIRSPSQTLRQLAERSEWYTAHGVGIALVVDYRDETIRVFRPGRPASTARGADLIPLDAIAQGAGIVVAEIFAALTID